MESLTSAILDLSNVPGGMISGMDTETLNWVTEESNTRYLQELDPKWIDEMLEGNNLEHFNDLSKEIEEEINAAERRSTPVSTKKQTEMYVRRFREFLSANVLSTAIETLPEEILARYLRFFYYKLRTKEGELYAPGTLIGIRAAIQRYLVSPEVNRKIDILKGTNFQRSNATLKAMVGEWLRAGGGKDNSDKFPAIEPKDFEKLNLYFNRSNPIVLQEEVWFTIVYFLGFRGREVVRELSPSSLQLETDSEGRYYAQINHLYLSKNIKASLNIKEYENLKCARIYEQSDDEENCPIAALKLYLSRLPDNCNVLFPLPLKCRKHDKQWYSNKKVVGKNSLGEMMKKISQKANLSRIYTNHCVRVSVVSSLKESGFSLDDIQAVTGHKSTDSIRHYVRRRKDTEKQRVSDALHSNLSHQGTSGIKRYKETQIVEKTEKNNEEIIQSQEFTFSKSFHPFQLTGPFHNCVFNFHNK